MGCGDAKRAGFLGVDILSGADYLCDIAQEPLPFADGSVDHLFSSHCLEHIQPDRLAHVFREFTRVAADGALLELWHPHAFHRDAFMFDHKNFLNEQHYYQPGRYPEHWEPILGGRWRLAEVRCHVERAVAVDLDNHGIDLDFAIQYLHDVVKEMGVFIRVDKSGLPPTQDFIRTVSVGGRDGARRALGKGPYRPDTQPTLTRLRRALWRRLRRSLRGG